MRGRSEQSKSAAQWKAAYERLARQMQQRAGAQWAGERSLVANAGIGWWDPKAYEKWVRQQERAWEEWKRSLLERERLTVRAAAVDVKWARAQQASHEDILALLEREMQALEQAKQGAAALGEMERAFQYSAQQAGAAEQMGAERGAVEHERLRAASQTERVARAKLRYGEAAGWDKEARRALAQGLVEAMKASAQEMLRQGDVAGYYFKEAEIAERERKREKPGEELARRIIGATPEMLAAAVSPLDILREAGSPAAMPAGGAVLTIKLDEGLKGEVVQESVKQSVENLRRIVLRYV